MRGGAPVVGSYSASQFPSGFGPVNGGYTATKTSLPTQIGLATLFVAPFPEGRGIKLFSLPTGPVFAFFEKGIAPLPTA